MSFNYLVKGISSSMMQINMQESKRFFSSEKSQNPNLIRDIPQFITGFTDAEGCFNISIFRNPKTRLGWSVKPIFQIELHYRDEKLLREIQAYFSGVGLIRKKGTRDICSYTVSSIKELLVILKHFDKFPLISQKCADYQLFKRAVELMERKEHLTTDGLKKIVATKSAMNSGLSEQLIAAFPSIVSSERSIVKDQKISDPYWIAGFMSGEGCFFVNIFRSSTHRSGFQVKLRVLLTQHVRDELLMRSLIEYFDCGNVFLKKEIVEFVVTGFSDIKNKIIPFFVKYPVIGIKAKDFSDFCKVFKLMENKDHLTASGLDQIRQIKAGMNRGRSYEESETSKVLLKNNNNIKTNPIIIHKRGFHSHVSVVSLYSKNFYYKCWPPVLTNNLCSTTFATFIISLHSRDKEILEWIKNYLKVGGITKQGPESCQFRVSSVKDLAVIINHFDKYPLITKKFADYELFKQAFYLIINKEHVKEEGLRKIIAIKASMNLGNSVALKEAFPGIVPVLRPSVPNRIIPDAHWLAGFTSGEGSFYINIKESPTVTTGYNVVLVFQLVQHSRDEFLIKSLIEFFKCGSIRHYKEAVFFRVVSDLINIIIPRSFFRFVGIKALDYADFILFCFQQRRKAAELMKTKAHTTASGLEQIRKLKAGMSTGRKMSTWARPQTKTIYPPRSETAKALGVSPRSIARYFSSISLHPPLVYEGCGFAPLHPWFITGFADAESSFSIIFRPNNKLKTGWSVEACFSIGLHNKDLALLELIRASFGVGNITKDREDYSKYRISSIKDLKAIIAHFDKYPLVTQKRVDFELFKKIVEMMSKKEHLTHAGLQEIINLRASLNLGLSDELKAAFPNTKLVERPVVVSQEIKDPNWIAGFTSGVRRPGVFLLMSLNRQLKRGML